jgi:hypothetical protein
MTFQPNPKPSQKVGAKPKKPSTFKSKPKPQQGPTGKSLENALETSPKAPKSASKGPPVISGQTKGALIQAMLSTPGGATSKELEAATGWQPHSVRGYLGTLRKAGVSVVSKKLKGEPTIYRIEADAQTEVL